MALPGPHRALVVTVVHHPQDSRIRHREIAALLEAGWQVTYLAPFVGHDLPVPQATPALTCVDLPRAAGRTRLAAARAARAAVRRLAPEHDIVLVHDPELLAATAGLGVDHLVWDVHEDPAGALAVKDWLPAPLRRPVAAGWRRAERLVERHRPLLLAEHAYADRFSGRHAVVPNAVVVPATVPPAGGARLVHVGNLTTARGSEVMVEAARLAHAGSDGAITLEVVGPARDEASRAAMERGVAAGHVLWRGFLPAAEAMATIDGALAGLSLLRDLPNYRGSMPTKVVEYLAHGVPAITTPLPLAEEIIVEANAGAIVPFDDAEATAASALRLWRDPAEAAAMGLRGRDLVRGRYDWAKGGAAFVAELTRIAGERSPRR
ncbi:glycosyltransferase family 4 protein [Janibacter sp. GS2]|uniref:glycosyltransferase family 4 protein n=1 Tax=Janibacter sp. GS2 TaxID=3442646 RepID=UPI003EB753F6